MIDGQTLAVLQKHIRRTGRSLLQYTGESFPWTRGQDRETLQRVESMLKKEQEAVTALTRFLVKQRVTPPHLGPYPMQFTTFNFLALDRLLVLVIEHQEKDVAELEEDIKTLPDGPGKEMLAKLLEIKSENLATLTELVKASQSANSQPPKETPQEEAASA